MISSCFMNLHDQPPQRAVRGKRLSRRLLKGGRRPSTRLTASRLVVARSAPLLAHPSTLRRAFGGRIAHPSTLRRAFGGRIAQGDGCFLFLGSRIPPRVILSERSESKDELETRPKSPTTKSTKIFHEGHEGLYSFIALSLCSLRPFFVTSWLNSFAAGFRPHPYHA